MTDTRPFDLIVWFYFNLFVLVLIIIYPAFLFLLGVRRFSRVSAAASSADLIAWAYILLVVTVSACPSLFATVVSGTPPAICKVAFVWRKPCSGISGKLCRSRKRLKSDDTTSGCSGKPFHFVNSLFVLCTENRA